MSLAFFTPIFFGCSNPHQLQKYKKSSQMTRLFVWLGMRDSNPRSWNQNPLPYHLANPQYLIYYNLCRFELLAKDSTCILQARNFCFSNKFESEAFLAKCHWHFSPRCRNQNPKPYHLANPQYLNDYTLQWFELLMRDLSHLWRPPNYKIENEFSSVSSFPKCHRRFSPRSWNQNPLPCHPYFSAEKLFDHASDSSVFRPCEVLLWHFSLLANPNT